MKSFLAPALLLLAAITPAFAARVVGSDIAGPIVAKELAAQTEAAGLRVTTDFRGGFDAMRELRAGKAAVAFVFLRKDERPPELVSGEWVAAPIAFQPIYVAVHRANKASSIDLVTLAGMYGKSTDDTYDTWRCVPGSGLSQGQLMFTPHPGKGLTVSAFRAEVLAGGDFRPSVRFANSDADAESRAVSTTNAIVLLSHPPQSGNLKVLALADTRGGKTGRPYAPNPSNLNSGDYPLVVTLYAIFPKAALAEAGPTVRALLSGSVAKLLEEKGLVPESENIRNKFIQSLDSGK
jgi:ABC-type phosphate transport system substrate-binding protein